MAVLLEACAEELGARSVLTSCLSGDGQVAGSQSADFRTERYSGPSFKLTHHTHSSLLGPYSEPQALSGEAGKDR